MRTKIPNLEKYDAFVVSTAGISELLFLNNKAKINVAFVHTPLRVAHNMYDYYKEQSLLYKLILPIAVRIYRLLESMAWKKIDYAFVLSDEV